MFHKIADWFESRGINHAQFTALLVLLVVGLLVALVTVPVEMTTKDELGRVIYYTAPLTTWGNLFITLGGIALPVGALLAVGFGLLYFLAGTRTDVYEAIFRRRNTAVAILVGFLFLSIAVAMGRG